MHHPQDEASQARERGANSINSAGRKNLALRVLTRSQSVTALAQSHEVSRKFVYQQARKAEQALDEAFDTQHTGDDDHSVLFQLPITKAWIRQYVLGSTLIGHTSQRGVVELLGDLFNYNISLGTVHNIIAQAIQSARQVQQNEDLSRVRIGAHDEIYQAGQPVLVGVDVKSTYCYLLEQADTCDGDTWALHLWDLQENKGLTPEATIADGGQALRSGQRLAWPAIPCHADIFHAEMNLGRVVLCLEDRACLALQTTEQLRRKHKREQRRHRRYASSSLGQKLQLAEKATTQAFQLAQDLAILARWMRNDVLALVGPDYQTRIQLFDFIHQELKQRLHSAPSLLSTLCTTLENQRDNLLSFVKDIDQNLQEIASQFQQPVPVIRELLENLDQHDASITKWQTSKHLYQRLGHKFYPISEALREMLPRIVRASSIVENVNSRLRNYFFLRRHIGPDYLLLLRFFLNHRRFIRSECPERQGKSPAELLTGQAHPHWLEMLGFQRYRRQAA
jgi:hypothetical protein